MVVSFAATIYIARHLGPQNYGQLSYAVSFVGLFGFIATIGIDSILYRELIKTPEKSNELLGTGFLIRVSTGIIAALICSTLAFFLAADDVSKVLIFILSGTFIINAFQIINHTFQAKVQPKYPAIITLIIVVTLNILKILTLMFDKGVIYLASILLLESILYALFYVYIYKSKLGGFLSRWSYDASIARTLIRDSLPLLFTTAFALIYSRIDQVFIKHMIDVSSVGIYDAAVRLAEVWYIIPSILVTTFFPAIINAKKTSEKLYFARIKKLAILLLTLALSISLVVSVLAPYIMRALYGEAFSSGTLVLQIYVWATVGIFLGTLVTNYLIAENYRGLLFVTSLIPMIMNVALNLLWIPSYGIAGAAYATLVSYLCVPLSVVLFPSTRRAVKNMVRP